MNASMDRLRAGLADLADEVAQVDLRDRVLRTSHALRVRRAVAITSAVATVIVAIGVVVVTRPDPRTAPMVPAVTPSPTIAPSVTPTPADNSPTGMTGTLFYLRLGSSSSAPAQLYSWTVGTAPRRLLILDGYAAIMNATVSPDGTRIAWVTNGDLGSGSLFVADIDGSNRRELRGKMDAECWIPVWSPDSRRLLVREFDPDAPDRARSGLVDVMTGDFRPVPKLDGCHGQWSADGSTIAHPDGGTGRIFLTDGRTFTNRRAIPNLGGDSASRFGFHLESISADGSRICLPLRAPGEPPGDVARQPHSNTVLDTCTGAVVPLPLRGRTLRQVVFLPDGGLLARVVDNADNRTLVLVSAAGEPTVEIAEPAAMRDMTILRYKPDR